MKLISWNVNGLRAAMGKGFMDTFAQLDADAFCLNETKLQPGQIELDLPGYHQYWNSAEKKGYSGVAVFTRQEPLSVRYGIGVDEFDHEGRVLTLEMPQFYLVSCYTPNSQDGLKRLEYRMRWEDAFLSYLKSLEREKPVVLCGDLNVAHQEIDIKNPKSNRMNAGFTDQEREKMTRLLNAGFVDTFRALHPDETGAYSWWSYRFHARENNAGWRIDYFIVSESLREHVREAGLDMDGIIVSEGYRTMEQQTSLWNKKVESLSGSYSGERLNAMAMRSTAYPGTSDYQTGLSVFVYNYKKGDNEFTSTLLHETEQGKWLYQNCWKYGYIFRYPIQGFPYADTVDKSFKTGYTDQMKVYRYVGVANAAAMNTLGMCLEESIEYLMAHPHIAVYSDGTLKYEIYRMEGGYSDTAVTVPYGAASYSASTDNMDGLIVAITY